MDRIEELLKELLNAECRRVMATVTMSGRYNQRVADRDALCRQIAERDQEMVKALEDIRRVIASRGRTNKDVYVSIPGEYVLMIDNMAARGIARAKGES